MPADNRKMTINEVNALSPEAFVEGFGFLFEHSPWVVEGAGHDRPFDDSEAMHSALVRELLEAPEDRRMDVIRAHPRLADKAAIAAGLTKQSASEQASAGLDALTPEEFERFGALNAAYDEKFGFPFIVVVRTAGGKVGILKAMTERLQNTRDIERRNALNEVVKIVWLRLQDVVKGEFE